jgi:hypothetical protein
MRLLSCNYLENNFSTCLQKFWSKYLLLRRTFIAEMRVGLHVKYPLLLPDFNQQYIHQNVITFPNMNIH